MPKGWPPLKHSEVLAIIDALGFTYSHTKGGHAHYKGTRGGVACSVTVSTHEGEFGVYLLKMMASQANCDRKEFYGATDKTAKKIK